VKNIKISVILCTYNREQFLPRAIESILCQTYTNFELVIVNNGSCDNTEMICQKYIECDARIKLITIEKNIGASYGKNTGIREANNEFITIVDDDDYCEPRLFEKLVYLKEKYNADISICGGWFEFENRLENYYVFEGEYVYNKIEGLDELLKREKYNVAPPAKLFRKKYMLAHPFESGVIVDDIHSIYKVFAEADVVATCGEPLYRWKKHSSNMTGFIENNKLTPEILKEYLIMQDNRVEYLSKKVPEIINRVKYARLSYMISMCDKIKTNLISECFVQYGQMIDFIKDNYEEFVGFEWITEKEKELLKEHLKECG